MQTKYTDAEEKRDLLTGEINHSDNVRNIDTTGTKSSKKKILIGVGVGLVVIGIVLAIVLPLTLNKDKPDDHPPNPFDFQEYNPYKVDTTKTKTTDWFAHGEVTLPSKIDNLF